MEKKDACFDFVAVLSARATGALTAGGAIFEKFIGVDCGGMMVGDFCGHVVMMNSWVSVVDGW